MQKIVVLTSILWSAVAFPCSFDTDCDVGAKCVKSGYGIYGVCVGGGNYGRGAPRDRGRDYEYDSYGSKRGNSCSFNTECGVGGTCLKAGSSLYGTCTD